MQANSGRQHQSKPSKSRRKKGDKRKYKNVSNKTPFNENKLRNAINFNRLKPMLPKHFKIPRMKLHIDGWHFEHMIAEINGSNIEHSNVDFKEVEDHFEFSLDEYQKSVIQAISVNESVVVFAPTSAGKTAVAEYAFLETLKSEKRVFFTSPIKALSNQKFQQFSKSFENVGLVTGDVSKCGHSRIMIMTTEILHDKLLREDLSEFLDHVSWVIFDEAHYLKDPERGFVWEECLILLPHDINVILLTTGVSNRNEIAEYVAFVRQTTCHVISSTHRPVPLSYCIIKGDSELENFGSLQALRQAYGRVNKSKNNNRGMISVKNELRPNCKLEMWNPTYQTITKITTDLKQDNLLPVIVFSFSRIRCEALLSLLFGYESLNSPNEMAKVETIYIDHLKDAKLSIDDQMLPFFTYHLTFLRKGYAVHHAGLVPQLKEIIEILFEKNLIKMLFATETFAVGVNMPAKTVVISDLQKFDGVGKRFLTKFELNQMAGRAGRRGFDKKGKVILMLDRECTLNVLEDLLYSGEMKLESRFHLSVSTMLRYPSNSTTGDLTYQDIIDRSFLFFQGYKPKISVLRESAKRLQQLFDENNFTHGRKDLVALYCNTFPLIETEVYHKFMEMRLVYISENDVINKILKLVAARKISGRLLKKTNLLDDFEDPFVKYQMLAKKMNLLVDLDLTKQQQYLADLAPVGHNISLINAGMQWNEGKDFFAVYNVANNRITDGNIIFEGNLIQAFKDCILILRRMESLARNDIDRPNKGLADLFQKIVDQMDRGIVSASSVYVETAEVDEVDSIDLSCLKI